MADNQDALKRVYSQLVSLRSNIQETHPNNVMEWDDINLYNELLSKLEAIGLDVDDFKIPSQMQTNEMVQTNYLTGATEQSGRSNVRFGFFKTKLDALLMYFQLNNEKTKMGFRDTDED